MRQGQILVALADVNGEFRCQEAFATPHDANTAVEELVVRIQRLLRSCPKKNLEGTGISLPGRVDHAAGRLVFAPKLNWPGFDLRTPVEAAAALT